jgi:hypothetical protein
MVEQTEEAKKKKEAKPEARPERRPEQISRMHLVGGDQGIELESLFEEIALHKR